MQTTGLTSKSLASGISTNATRALATSPVTCSNIAHVRSPRVAAPQAAGSRVVLPTANAGFDYQLGGAYSPASGVTVVTRDMTSTPAAGTYGICYINAFQTQGPARSWWLSKHPRLVLRDAQGQVIGALLTRATDIQNQTAEGVGLYLNGQTVPLQSLRALGELVLHRLGTRSITNTNRQD